MPKNDFDKAFAREFQKLNVAQRQAVETIEGPLMIIAGPGTGKTQVVALRIGQILQKTQLNPRNILALTFTEAGVTALQKRLEKIIGPDAYQVTVTTFHSFANDIVSTFPYLFGFVQEAAQATDLERLQILHRIIERDEELRALRPVRAPTFHVRAVGDAIRKLKQENVTPQQLKKLVRLTPTNIEEKLTAAAQAARKRQRQLNLELAKVYAAYQAELKRLTRYDYEDMILFAIEALATDTDVKAYYQERYHYVLVDEYQDTNNAQNTLVERLVDFFQRPNICVVGDDKQAIYRFQGASVANMLHFAKTYPDLTIVTLRENYRSVAPILRSADTLIARNSHQLTDFLQDIPTELVPTRAKTASLPALAHFPNEETEFQSIVDQIKKRLSSGVASSEIAVLFRTNDGVKRFRTFALVSGLEIAGGDSTDLAGEPVVHQFLGLLEAINRPTEPRLVVPALRLIRPLSPFLLARYAETLRDQRRLVAKASLTVKEQTQIKDATDQLERWGDLIQDKPLVEAVQTILCESRLLGMIEMQPNSLEQLEYIKRLINEVRQFALTHPSARLDGFLGYIALLRSYRLRLSVPRLLPETDGVFVGTVHAAKGLEFDTVFLPNVSAKAWNDRGKRELIKLPSEVVDLKNWREDVLEDERRLFYVALTRAKDYLHLSLADFDDEGRELLPSQFVSELADTVSTVRPKVSKQAVQAALKKTLWPVEGVILAKQEQRLIRELLMSRPFSFTDYKAYQLCPQQFLLSSVLKFPARVEPRLVYGSLLHRALELFYKKYRSTKKLPSEVMLGKFLTDAARSVEPFVGKSAIVEQSRELLKAFYPTLLGSTIPAGVEYSLTSHHVLLEDIWVTGKFDRIDLLDPTARTVRIVDYKTGAQAKTRNAIVGNTKNSDGVLREQLVYYSLLTSLDRHFPYHATEFSLLFLDDAHTFREEVFSVTADERDRLGADVVKTYREILERTEFVHEREEFDRGCEVCELFRKLG